jgi:hypothetical protein
MSLKKHQKKSTSLKKKSMSLKRSALSKDYAPRLTMYL